VKVKANLMKRVSEQPSENLSVQDEHENTLAIINSDNKSESSNSDKENSNIRNNKQ
jgi:hypothetical protein